MNVSKAEYFFNGNGTSEAIKHYMKTRLLFKHFDEIQHLIDRYQLKPKVVWNKIFYTIRYEKRLECSGRLRKCWKQTFVFSNSHQNWVEKNNQLLVQILNKFR